MIHGCLKLRILLDERVVSHYLEETRRLWVLSQFFEKGSEH